MALKNGMKIGLFDSFFDSFSIKNWIGKWNENWPKILTMSIPNVHFWKMDVFRSFFTSFLAPFFIPFFWKMKLKMRTVNTPIVSVFDTFPFFIHFSSSVFQVAKECFGVVCPFCCCPIWQSSHFVHHPHDRTSKKIKIKNF